MLLLCIAAALAPGPPQAASPIAPTILQQAQKTQSSGNLQASLDLYQQVLQNDPADTEAQAGMSDVSEKMALAARSAGDERAALTDLVNAAKYAPNNPRLLYDTAVLEEEMRLYWDADAEIGVLEKLPVDQQQPAVLYLAARIKMDLGQLAAAVQRMRAYLNARPDDASAHYGLGRMLQLQENFPDAKAQFEASLALEPHQTESQFQLGEIALAQNEYGQAIDDYAQTLAGNPKHAGALAGTGIAWFHLQKYDAAEAALRQAIAADPDYQPAHYYLGLTLARLGQKDEAEQQLAQATTLGRKQADKDAQRLHIEQNQPTSGQPAAPR